jgi:hypothetical protein
MFYKPHGTQCYQLKGSERFGGAIMAEKSPEAIGYVRVSTEEQANQGVSLEPQRAKVLVYCGLHGLELAQTYADEGLSGKRADNRPGLHVSCHRCPGRSLGIRVRSPLRD